MEYNSHSYLPKSNSVGSGFNRLTRRTKSNVSRELATANHDTHRRRPSAPVSSYSLSPAPQYKIQLILIGDRNVGKTCVLERFTENQFHDDLTSTVGIDFKLKTITMEGRSIRLQIWDTAGQERFNSITTAYYRGAKGIVVMYDVTRVETFLNIRKWLELIEEYGRSDAVIAVVGNKYDLKKVQVDSSKARKFAQDRGYLFFETSAKSSMNIEKVFYTLIKEAMTKHPLPQRDRNFNEKSVTQAVVQPTPSIAQPSTQETSNKQKFSCC